MPAGTQNQNQNAVSWLFRNLWITFTFCGLSVHGQKGEGCGHTRLGAESGTLASAGYPGTYPQDVSCEWTLRVPQGRTLILVFGDFDIEGSRNCSNGSLVITPSNGPLGVPMCGKLVPSPSEEMRFSLSTNEAKVTFRSGRHRSGRGFLLSYATDQHPDVLSCKTLGSHLSSNQLSAYCPAGCKDVPGEVKGSFEEAYSDNSVVCKSAVHGGVVSDTLGGRVTGTREKGLRYYPSSFANGVKSQAGSLSYQKLLFRRECNDNLTLPLVGSGQRERANAASPFQTWTPDQEDLDPLVKLDLGAKRTVTGVITTGSVGFSIESYTLLFSKDGETWKPYKGAESKEVKTFEANSGGHERVLNSLFPPGVGRYVHLKPITSGKRGSAQIQLLGCPFVRAGSRSSSSTTDDSTDAPVSTANAARTQYSTVPAEETDLAKDPTYPPDVPKVNAPTTQHGTVPNRVTVLVTDPSSGQPVGLVVGVVLGLVACGGFLLAGLWWKRRKKKNEMKNSAPGGPVEYHTLQGKSQGEYGRPAGGGLPQGSTFRPGPNPDHAPAFSLGRYHTPGAGAGAGTAGPEPVIQEGPEYAQPFPSEPEYATPFSEPLPEPARTPRGPGKDKKRSLALPPPPPPPPTCGGSSAAGDAHYDCPSHQVLSNGYCTPAPQGPAPRPASVVYSEPEPAYSLLQEAHTYEELL